ncbi:SDR family oxidoreductase [Sphingomonas sp. CGMCC 1.13654]|uniref:SDR family oxidoreductase n=1 Tax=Sphingomonas chungangi TaxID=2683589 RepID=A0A838L0N3_9SPHN|nr:SDR family oxidoreductase [Sphingomonas chungangi]MBA2933053.1 SDR family oxidoreductase [Sphingomonas chungangi]MVW56673.1 NAD(P)H-binding protein [Sphingomonas chungangi]
MHVLIVGASGFVGRHLAGRLATDGTRVTVAGRDTGKLARLLPGLAAIGCDLARDTMADWLPRLTGVDVVVNCAGLIRDAGGRYALVHDAGARILFDACLAAGVTRVVQVSALGADDQATTRYHLSKRAADDHLAALDPTGERMDWVVLRPSLIVGRGGQSTALFTCLAAAPLPIRLGPGNWLLQPIHVDDLVKAIVRLLHCAGPIAARIDAAGPEAMTTDEITLGFRRWLGLAPARFLIVPRGLVAASAWIGQRLGLGAATPESLAMLEAGNTGDPVPFEAACGFRAAPLDAALARTPATPMDLAEARIAPLRSVLRIALALIWLAGGIVPLTLTPRAASMALLARTGITGGFAPIALFGASAIDFAIGMALLFGFRVRSVSAASIGMMAAYSAILAACFPALWADPFGPLVKNIAVLGLALAVRALETDRG